MAMCFKDVSCPVFVLYVAHVVSVNNTAQNYLSGLIDIDVKDPAHQDSTGSNMNIH